MAGIKWTEEQDKYLIDNYYKGDKELLLINTGNRSWNGIKNRAKKLQLNRWTGTSCNTEWLLQDTLLAYYWVGFILADGHFTKSYRLAITLSEKDSSHLEKLAKLFNCEVKHRGKKYKRCTIVIQDKIIFKKLMEKFDIKHRKTYEPPNINIIPNSSLGLAMLIGFIDGDGCIKNQSKRKDLVISIKNHGSWKCVLDRFSEICGNTVLSRITKKKYCVLDFSNRKIVRMLYEFQLGNQLPSMERKWNKCKDMPLSKNEIDKNLDVKRMLLEGFKPKEISVILKVSQAYISNIKTGKR